MAGRRFIPACAGNTLNKVSTTVPIPVHPRVCGEHQADTAQALYQIGSSPRVRGTHRLWPKRRQTARFIPACAGNTYEQNSLPSASSVHPRVCGEHQGSLAVLIAFGGSSPRVRGTPKPYRLIANPNRFIPACAGNTHNHRAHHGCLPVHPRVCGEHDRLAIGTDIERVSSPRVRGTRRAIAGIGARARFIPACAGNTPMRCRMCRSWPVHPRVCGEHPGSGKSSALLYGSSPRVRGTLSPLTRLRLIVRFIPACAGNTSPP